MLDNGFLNVIKLEQAGGESVPITPAKDPSAAERQRRSRAKRRAQRDTVAADRDTVTADRDTVTGVTQRNATDRDDELTLLPKQDQVTLTFTAAGDLVLRQACPLGSDDSVIVIASDNVDKFIDRLTDAVGIPTFGGP